MAKTKDKVLDRAGERGPTSSARLEDEDLRDNVRNAFESARVVYNELIGGRGAIRWRHPRRDRQGDPGPAEGGLDELREAADRVQGKKDHGARNTCCCSRASRSASSSTPSPVRRRASGSPTRCSARATIHVRGRQLAFLAGHGEQQLAATSDASR